MSFSFLFFLFFFLTQIIAGQWWPQPCHCPLMHMQALTTPTPSPAQPTSPVTSMSNTCSRCWPNPTATTTTTTPVTAPQLSLPQLPPPPQFRPHHHTNCPPAPCIT